MRIVWKFVYFAIITALFGAMIWYVEPKIVEKTVFPTGSIDNWMRDFRTVAVYGFAVAVLGSLLWFFTAQWFRSVHSWKRAGGRGVWLLIGVLFCIVAVALSITMHHVHTLPAEGDYLAYVFYFVNPVFSYYLTSLVSTPDSYRFTPVGATAFIRRR